MQIRGTVAIVTGASSGIGAATAVELARRGAVVASVARREDKLAATATACQRWTPRSFAVPADVGDAGACVRLVEEVKQRAGAPVDILVNNAGISPVEDPVHHAAEDAERIMAVNFFGAVRVSGAVLPEMVARRRGSIINVTSVSGYVPNPGEPAYGASKAALSRWSHGLAVDLAGDGVHVGVLSPGPIDTEIWSDTGTEYSGKLYSPEMVATAIARMIDRGQQHVTVPRRFGAVSAAYPLAGRPMRWGLRRYAKAAPPTTGPVTPS
ncbi:MAG TPA: SDR family NAD(P)-dependent oxidoreductase [Acidimicrobiales bacterium]